MGKTADEVLGIAVDEATKPAEADLAPASPSPSAASRPCWKNSGEAPAAVPAAPLPPSDRLRRSGGGGDEAQAISGDLSGRVRYSDHGHGLCGEQEDFTETAEMAHDLLLEYHQLYDIYNDYDAW